MLIRRLNECERFTAGDGTELRELLHADKGKFSFGYSLAHAILPPGKTSRPHRLKTSEMYYILDGEGMMHIDGESAKVTASCAVYIPPGSTQFIENTGKGDLLFLCVVDPAWRKEDEEIF